MPGQNRPFLTILTVLITFITLTGTCLSQGLMIDEFGIGQFSINPNSFRPDQGEIAIISGTVYHLSPEGNLSSPSITVEIDGQLSLLVTITPLSQELLAENSLAQLGEWSFSATWNGTSVRGGIVSPGEYTCTVSLDLPGVGKVTKSRTITVNAIE